MQRERSPAHIDRILRIALGHALIGLHLNVAIGVWGGIGVVPLVTAFVKFCPIYAILGMMTCQDC